MIEFCKSVVGGIEMITARNFLKGKLVTLIWGVFSAGACKQNFFKISINYNYACIR